jgi:hypothetical protein
MGKCTFGDGATYEGQWWEDMQVQYSIRYTLHSYTIHCTHPLYS